jgi:hypothetical protein
METGWQFLRKLKVELPHVTQQFQFWVCMQKNGKQSFEEKLVHTFLVEFFTIA